MSASRKPKSLYHALTETDKPDFIALLKTWETASECDVYGLDARTPSQKNLKPDEEYECKKRYLKLMRIVHTDKITNLKINDEQKAAAEALSRIITTSKESLTNNGCYDYQEREQRQEASWSGGSASSAPSRPSGAAEFFTRFHGTNASTSKKTEEAQNLTGATLWDHFCTLDEPGATALLDKLASAEQLNVQFWDGRENKYIHPIYYIINYHILNKNDDKLKYVSALLLAGMGYRTSPHRMITNDTNHLDYKLLEIVIRALSNRTLIRPPNRSVIRPL